MSQTLQAKKTLVFIFAIGLIITASLALYSNLHQNSEKKTEQRIDSRLKTIRYSFEISNKENVFIEESKFFAFAPVAETSSQKVVSLTATENFELETDRYGNQVMGFVLKNLAPYSKRTITITAEVAFFDMPRILNEKAWMEEGDIFLSPERFIESDNEKILSTALAISKSFEASQEAGKTQSSPLVTHKWVASHLDYAGYTKKDFGALYALEKQLGDCTEYMYLFTALMRAQNIKSHGLAGFRVEGESGLLRADEYHNWSSFLDEESVWRMADPQNNVFDSQYDKYLAFRVLVPDELKTMTNTHRFLAFDQRLKVTMM